VSGCSSPRHPLQLSTISVFNFAVARPALRDESHGHDRERAADTGHGAGDARRGTQHPARHSGTRREPRARRRRRRRVVPREKKSVGLEA